MLHSSGGGNRVYVTSISAQVSQTRPFYADHADAYDLLVTDPVEPWVEAVDQALASCGWASALVLDAGCGTGRHAAALAARGHRVDLVDAAAPLLAKAAARNPGSRALEVDLCGFTTDREYQAVMCRGVLNDMTTDAERDAALGAFAAALMGEGLLVLDVRESEGSRRRADGVPRHRVVDLGESGLLEFTNTVTWNSGLMRVLEQSELRRPGSVPDRREYEFVMRPWSADELRARLGRAGFVSVDVRPGVGRAMGDRLFVTARRGG